MLADAPDLPQLEDKIRLSMITCPIHLAYESARIVIVAYLCMELSDNGSQRLLIAATFRDRSCHQPKKPFNRPLLSVQRFSTGNLVACGVLEHYYDIVCRR